MKMGFGAMDAVFFLGMLAIMWFLIVMPRRREQQAHAKMMSALKKGDKVMTTSGMIGEVNSLKDGAVTLRFHDNVRIDFDRSAISKKLGGDSSDEKDVKPKLEEAKA